MLIQGNNSKVRNNFLIKYYKDLILKGVMPQEILVIVLNPYKKNLFVQNLENQGINQSENSKIYTLNGLFYNAFKDNTNYIKSVLNCWDNDELHQCGLEVSQYIFKQSIKEADFSDYISKVNLLHQLFRRYSLIVQNALTDEEIEKRSEILGEVFAKDAYKAILDYKKKTIKYKSFDYLRQTAIFPLIYQNTDYFKDIKYLIVDDADEMPYILWQFIDYIMPELQDYFIAYDKSGSSRCGYLCAYKSGIFELKKKYNSDEIICDDTNLYSDIADKFFEHIKSGKKLEIKNIKYVDSTNRFDMLNSLLLDIKNLIGMGVKPQEIAVITPIANDMIQKFKSSSGLKFQYVSGSEKLSDIKGIKHIISIIKLINKIELKDYEIKSILIDLLGIPGRKCFKIIQNFDNTKIKDFEFNDDLYDSKYKKLQNIVNSLLQAKYTLSEQIKIIFDNIIKEYININESQKYEFLLKEAQTFEQAFSGEVTNLVSDFIVQLENSVISENPVNSFNIKSDEIIISSPQKLIDYSIKTKYQLWLDISNSEWLKQDTGTLYNAWVFNRDWGKKEYSLEDNIELTRDKTARIVRKLMLLAGNEIRFYSSIYDNDGNENFGGLLDFLSFGEEKKPEFKIIPRDDQKPVLEYKNGKMGIMAVPGAGKTTILLALIIKLIESGVSPENIFVLTYMESAAKNFKERIKLSIAEGSELPNISTIHGLALRIIKENGNYIKAGLDENFEICDDIEKEKIIKELFYKLKIQDEKYDNYLRCISIVKLSDVQAKLSSKYPDIQEFYTFFNEYNSVLKQKNLVDYDDMLRFAVDILKNNKVIKDYYANICHYIIEDEAQDSTEIQQSLLNLLSSKYNNIVRCGDINQSITSTFTNSNLESFKQFILDNKKVEMVSSQRCAKPIYELANKMIDSALSDKDRSKAFYNINIKGTSSNPVSDINPEYMVFEHEKDEKSFILNKIKEIQIKSPKASIAVLLRMNSDVNKYNEYFLLNGLKTDIRTDSISQKGIYKYINAILNIIENPFNNKVVKNLAELYISSASDNRKKYVIEYFDNLTESFINENPDELDDEILCQLYWDINYWLDNADKPIEDIALNAGLYYSVSSSDKSNSYLISIFIKKVKENNSGKELLKTIEYYAKRQMSAYKFFENNNGESENAVNIMTMHKSKGDEFDFVFIPQLNEDNYALEVANVKLKSGSHFVQTIKNSLLNSGIKSPNELKKEQMEETLRLLYVGITRAKIFLFLSTAKKYLTIKNSKISDFISNLTTIE